MKKLKKKPVRIEIGGRPYVLFRDAAGRPGALEDVCAHRFAPLSKGWVQPDGRLACPYHGWNFDAQGKGCNPSQPTLLKCDVKAFQVIERHDYLWIADRDTPISAFPVMEWEGYEYSGSFNTLLKAPIHVTLANFTENEHVPYVHARLGWDNRQLGEIDFAAENYDDRTEVTYRAPQRPSPFLVLMRLKAGDIYHNEWVSRFDPVHTVYTITWTDARTDKVRPVVLRAVIFMTPETEKTSRFHVFLYLKLLNPQLRPLMPIIRRAALALTWFEVDDDARFIPAVANTPFELKGMRLDKYDKPIIHNLKLLKSIYYGEPKSGTREVYPEIQEFTQRAAEKAIFDF